MKKISAKYLLIILSLLIDLIGIHVHAQNIQKGIFFSDDEIKQTQQSINNISSYKKDKVRADVFKFDGKNKPYRVPYNQETALSFICWLRPQNIDTNPGTIFGKHKSFYFRYLSNRKVQFNHYLLKDIHTSAFITENQWQHLGFTLNKNGQLNIFFNGKKVASDSINSNWWKKEGDYVFGSDLYDISSNGFIDEIKVWNRELTENEITEMYNQTLLSPELKNRLLMYCPLQEDFNDLVEKKRDIQIHGNITFKEDSNSRKGAYFCEDLSFISLSNFLFDKQQTIALWIKPKSSKNLQALISNRDFVLRYVVPNNQLWYSVPLQFGIQSGVVDIEKDSWIHVAISVIFNNRIDFYINGKCIDSKTINDKTGNSGFIEIGRSIWGNTYEGFMSNLAIWDRALTAGEVSEVYQGKLDILSFNKKQNSVWFYLILLGIIATVFSFYLFSRSKKEVLKEKRAEEKFQFPKRKSIFFFNSFNAYDSNGKDISAEFTPTLIRIFALILIYPKVYGHRISSANFSNILWPDDDIAQQKNNRNSNIHKLRSVLKNFEGLSLEFKNKEWAIEVPDDLFIDLENVEKMVYDYSIEIPFVSLMLDRVLYGQGTDQVFQMFNDKMIQLLGNQCIKSLDIKNYKRALALAKLWLSIDSLSDEALRYGVKSLMKLGHRETAIRFYKAFSRNYTILLNEDYPYTFKDLDKR